MDHNFDENQVFLPITMVRRTNLPIILFVVFGTVAWVSVTLRTITRSFILKRFGWDDATMILSLVNQLLLVRATEY
jgi:nicotinamide riboside transporter PnuC